MQHITKQRHHFANKSPYTQSCGFSSSHIWMWELDHKEGWALKNWCFQAVGLEKTLGSPLDSREIKAVNPKGNKRWIFTGMTDAEAETPNTLATWYKELTHWKRPWCWGRLRAREGGNRYEMVGWHHWPSGHEFAQTQGDREGQGSLTCYSLQGCKEPDTT